MPKPNEQLNEFMARARAAGKTEGEVRTMLLDAGWDPALVTAALAPVGELVPPAPPAPKSTGREIFFYLLQFVTLAITAVSLGRVIFAVIDRYLPSDVVGAYYSGGYSPVPWPLAALIVVAPIFFLVSRALVSDIAAGRSSAMSKIRRLLMYLALFLASATVIGDVIALVYRFLAGEVTTRFLLKVFTILLLGGWVIVYYFLTVKRDEFKAPYPRHWHRWNGLLFGIIVVAVMGVGFMLAGSPLDRQKYVRDQRRVADLQSLYYNLQNYYEREQALPGQLSDLNQGYAPSVPQDPATAQTYEYIPGERDLYQLCAVFESADPDSGAVSVARPVSGPYDVNWSHPLGRYCYKLSAARPKL